MATSTLKTISAALELVDAKKQNLKKAFDELLQHSYSSSSSFPLDWSHLDSHFNSIHETLTQRFQNLQSHESQKKPIQNLNGPSPSSSKVSNFPSIPSDPTPSSDPIPQNDAVSVPDTEKPHAEALGCLCKNMDGKALRDYVGDNLKDRAAIKDELSVAMKRASDPAAMVLSSMDGVFAFAGGANAAVDVGGLKKMKRSCNVLFRQLRVVGPNLSGKVKNKARKFASEWKESMMSDNGNANGNGGGDSVGAMAFLNFVAAYGLLSELSVNELATFSAMAAANDELPELYQIIGLMDKVPALVQKLIERGKHVLAVKYVFEFNLTDKIPPVPILEAYVNESEKLARRLSEEGKSLTEITARQIHALKSAIKVVENHNLDSEYPRASLEQRIEQLKKHKANVTVKHYSPAFAKKPPQHHQQQSGTKRPRTSAPAGPVAVLNNVNSTGSTVHHYQQPHFQPTGLLREHPNPYMSLPTATQFGMVAPAPSISPYQGPSTGPYGLAGDSMGSSGNSGQSSSHPNPSEQYVPSGYYDGNVSGYGGYGLQQYYQTSYPQ